MSICTPIINYTNDKFPHGNVIIKPFDKLVKHPTPQLFTPHRGEFNKLFWIEKGSGGMNIDFVHYDLEDNQLFLISQEPVYYFEDNATIKGFVILFKNEVLPQIELFLNVQIGLGLNKMEELKKVMACLLYLVNYEFGLLDNPKRVSVLHYYLAAIVQLLVAEHKKACDEISPASSLYVQFLEKILLNGNCIKTIEDYANMLHVSKETLLKDVKDFSGKTPKNIIDQYIVLEAKRRLSFDFDSIKEIAHGLGFTYNSYFNKFFKRHVGITPLEFRKLHSCIYIVSWCLRQSLSSLSPQVFEHILHYNILFPKHSTLFHYKLFIHKIGIWFRMFEFVPMDIRMQNFENQGFTFYT